MSVPAATTPRVPVGYLGPAGSWTHQACIELYGEDALVPYGREQLFTAFAQGRLDRLCVPVTTSVVGATPYLDDVLAMRGASIVAEYTRTLGYSLLVQPRTTRAQVKTVLAHPVALQEVKPWLDREMPTVERRPAASGGAAAEEVAGAAAADLAAMAPPAAAQIHGLVALAQGIEEGPHNVTRWWVIGREAPPPTGHDKTSLRLQASEQAFGSALQTLSPLASRVLAVYERPGGRTLDAHVYVIDLAGHAAQEPLKSFLAANAGFGLLGSYPRRY
jgi:prephenate dehydratase